MKVLKQLPMLLVLLSSAVSASSETFRSAVEATERILNTRMQSGLHYTIVGQDLTGAPCTLSAYRTQDYLTLSVGNNPIDIGVTYYADYGRRASVSERENGYKLITRSKHARTWWKDTIEVNFNDDGSVIVEARMRGLNVNQLSWRRLEKSCTFKQEG